VQNLILIYYLQKIGDIKSNITVSELIPNNYKHWGLKSLKFKFDKKNPCQITTITKQIKVHIIKIPTMKNCKNQLYANDVNTCILDSHHI